MNKFILIGVAAAALTSARAQDDASKPAASSDVESLRQQVQALTETVKELQQQVKEQQAAKANGSAPSLSPQNGGTPSVASTSTEGRDGARPSSTQGACAPKNCSGRRGACERSRNCSRHGCLYTENQTLTICSCSLVYF